MNAEVSSMVVEINRLLVKMGSKFHTDDGLLLIRHCGELRLLCKRFNTLEECLAYVKAANRGGTDEADE